MKGATGTFYLTFAALASLVMSVLALQHVTPGPLTGDSHQNVRIAYHLIHTGIWGYDNVETPNPRPQFKREPLPILAPAALMLFDPAFEAQFSIRDVTEGHLAARIKRVNAFWVFLASFAIFLLTAELFGTPVKSVLLSLILILISAYVLFLPSMAVMETEVPATFFLLIATWLGIRFTRDRNVHNAVLLGVALGLLCLVKAAFLFIGLAYIGLLFLLQAPISGAVGRFSRQNLICYGLIGGALIATVAPWIVRNAITFHQPVITSRGGDVFAFRALLTEHSLEEWLYDFSPNNVRPAIAALFGLSVDGLETDSRYDQLKRKRWDVHYKKKLDKAGIKLSKRHAEAWLALRAVKYYTQHPFRYAASSLLFAYRGIWLVRPPDISKPARAAVRMAVTIINAAAFLAFVSLFAYALLRRNPVLSAFTGIAIGSFLFYSLFTHNITRYSEPLLPFMFLSMVWWANSIIVRLRNSPWSRSNSPAPAAK